MVVYKEDFIVVTALLVEHNKEMLDHSTLMDPVPEGLNEYAKEWNRLGDGMVHDHVYGTVALRKDDILDICDYYPGHCTIKTSRSTFTVKGTTIDILEQMCEK